MIVFLLFITLGIKASPSWPDWSSWTQTKVTWPGLWYNEPFTIIESNTPIKINCTLQFPGKATARTFHFLSLDNPGPRPDSYSLALAIAHPNRSVIRMMFEQEMPAINGEWNQNLEFILPSYLVSPENEMQDFIFLLSLSNLDQIMDVIAQWVTVSASPEFRVKKLEQSPSLAVPDTTFIRNGDRRMGKTVSLYYGIWYSPSDELQKQLIKSVFFNGASSTSLESHL